MIVPRDAASSAPTSPSATARADQQMLRRVSCSASRASVSGARVRVHAISAAETSRRLASSAAALRASHRPWATATGADGLARRRQRQLTSRGRRRHGSAIDRGRTPAWLGLVAGLGRPGEEGASTPMRPSARLHRDRGCARQVVLQDRLAASMASMAPATVALNGRGRRPSVRLTASATRASGIAFGSVDAGTSGGTLGRHAACRQRDRLAASAASTPIREAVAGQARLAAGNRRGVIGGGRIRSGEVRPS